MNRYLSLIVCISSLCVSAQADAAPFPTPIMAPHLPSSPPPPPPPFFFHSVSPSYEVVPQGPAPELSPQPGTVPMTFGSEGRRLRLSAHDGSSYGVDNYRGYIISVQMFRPLCDTPCTLYLPPGSGYLRVDGDGVRPSMASFDVPPAGADLRLRAPTVGKTMGGVALFAIGGSLLAGGIALLVNGEVGNTTIPDYGPPRFQTTQNSGQIAGGAVMMGVGLAGMLGGIVLFASNRGGVASSTPHTPATAKLSVGAGNSGLRGTF